MIKAAHAGEAEEWIERMERLTDHATKGTKAVIPTEALQDQATIKIDNITIKAHLVDRAHTKTDAMLEVVEDQVLFTGDIVNNERLVVFENGSFRGSIKTIQQAEAMSIKKVVPGHGKTAGKEALTDNRELLNTIYTTAQALMEEGLEAHEMKPAMTEKLMKFQHWGNIEEEIGRYIIKAVLEAEQALCGANECCEGMTTRWRDKILFPVSRDFVSLYLRSGLEFPILDNHLHLDNRLHFIRNLITV